MFKIIACTLGSLVASVAFAQSPAAPAKPAAAAPAAAAPAKPAAAAPAAAAPAAAAPAASDCASKAVGKDGKPLAGAAKSSFMKKCEADAKGAK